jgi:hypothetical protein
MIIAPYIVVNARMWTVSISGNAQTVAEIAWPTHRVSAHWKNGRKDSHIG